MLRPLSWKANKLMDVKLYDNMRPSTIHMDGSKPTTYNISCQVVYSKYTIYDVSYMQFYTTCRSYSQRNDRVAGL